MLVAAAAPTHAAACSLRVLHARSTTKQWVSNGKRVQIVEADVANDGASWITPARPVRVRVDVAGASTVRPAAIRELGPGERMSVEIGIANNSGVADGTRAHGSVNAAMDGGCSVSLAVPLVLGVSPYTSDPVSLRTHEAPDWFDNAKFGIFIHWGVYSVPAWGPVGSYAEWYWNALHKRNSPTFEHQLALHGPNSRYDQFIPRFRAQNFDPKAWVDLFHEAGARYFVLTSKHHEGFALFKTATTHRSAVDLGPHRDLVAALFAAARKYQPELHPGLYYSLYEWYNPAYTGHPVRQYYTGKPVPYTGYVPVKSYVDDHMLPQMREIVDQYHPSVLWCDGEWEKPSGYWHDAHAIAHYYNQALARGQGVAIDDRCRVDGGANERKQTVYDFSTPEYTTYSKTVAKKWEASRGMGYSYGYNANEQPKDYKTAGDLVRMLVDMVSKNGNLLLDIGPKADGTIPAIMQQRLRDIGAWLRVNGEAIYDTHYWWRTPQDGDLRFTVKPNQAFYIISLVRPGSQIVVHAPVPIAPGDKVTLLGYRGAPLHWTKRTGNLIIDVPPDARRTGEDAWAFKVAW